MKKIIMTSVMAIGVIGGANASVYLNWGQYNPETNPNAMTHLDITNPGAGAEHNFNLIQNAINQNAAAFGFAVGLTDKWSMNAGAGLSSADTTWRAGTNYKFKLF